MLQCSIVLYVLCYPALSVPDTERIEAFRRVHEPLRADLVRAHITLVFGVSSMSRKDLRNLVVSVAAKARPIPISLDGLTIWQDPMSGEGKLFLKVCEGRDGLISLHRKLYEGLGHSGFRPDIPFDPHVTVATASSQCRIQAAKAAASVLALPVFGHIEALEIVSLHGDKLSSVDHIRLGGHQLD
jgi:2'-5' RNA ligase